MMANDFQVLVIDDNEDLRTVLSEELGAEGYAIHTAANGEDGIAILRQNSISLVLLDIRLPGIGGFEVLRLIKRDFPEVKVVMITAHSDVYHAMESRRLGADDFLGKPYDLGEVITIIERLRSS